MLKITTDRTAPQDSSQILSSDFVLALGNSQNAQDKVAFVKEVSQTSERACFISKFQQALDDFFKFNSNYKHVYTLKRMLGAAYSELVPEGRLKYPIYETQFRTMTKQNKAKVEDLGKFGYSLQSVLIVRFQGGRVFVMLTTGDCQCAGLIVDQPGMGIGIVYRGIRVLGVDPGKNQRACLYHERKFHKSHKIPKKYK